MDFPNQRFYGFVGARFVTGAAFVPRTFAGTPLVAGIIVTGEGTGIIGPGGAAKTRGRSW